MLRAPPGTPTISTFLEALRRNRWHDRAACRDSDPGLFDIDLSHGQARYLASPKILAAFLVCDGCEVRWECLRESLRRVHVKLSDEAATEAAAAGVWGGSTEWDRRAVRHLPREDAAAELERTFPERLAQRVAAFQAAHSNGHPPTLRVREVRRVLVGIGVRAAEATSVAGLPDRRSEIDNTSHLGVAHRTVMEYDKRRMVPGGRRRA
jgi:hypothetical protein